jgi:hypothetical protein
MEKMASYWNTASVGMKTLAMIFSAITFVMFFYFQAESHMNNKEIHISSQQILNMHTEMQKLRDRIEKLEWDLRGQQERCTKRHNRQEGKILKWERKKVE